MESNEIDLNKAFERFAKEQTQEAYEYVLYTLFMSAKHELGIHIPVEIGSNKEMTYGLVRTTDGYYYEACTSTDQLALCPESSSILTTIDLLVVNAANDKEVNGICINPYSKTPCFVPRAYIRRFLDC